MAADVVVVRRFVGGLFQRYSKARETVAQAVKAGIATAAAWLLAAVVFDIPQPYLAAWAALVMVRPTVRWSFATAVRQVAAVLLGVGIAVVAVALPGKALALAVAVVAGFLVGRWPRLDDQGLYVSFTALIIIALDDLEGPIILGRLLETGLGALVGTAVNLLVMPPIRLRAVRTQLHEDGAATADALRGIAARLCGGDKGDAADRLRDLRERPERLRPHLQRARDSLHFNPRPRRRTYRAEVDRLNVAFELVQNAIGATLKIDGLLEGDGGAHASRQRLEGDFCDRYAAAIEEAADMLTDRLDAVLAGDDARPSDPPAGEHVEALEQHGRPPDAQAAALHGALVIALRELLTV